MLEDKIEKVCLENLKHKRGHSGGTLTALQKPGFSITFLVSGWFCEVGGCGKKGAVKEFIKISNVQEEAKHTEKGLLDILVVLLN